MDGDPVHSGLVPGRVKLTSLTAIVLLGATWTGGAPAAGLGPPVVKPTQQLAALINTHKVHRQPVQGSAPIGLVGAKRPITEERTVLPVLGHRTTRGVPWLLVRLPGRPNGRTGWIRKRATLAWRTSWHIVVYTSSRRVAVYQRGRRVRVFSAVVGKRSTPTPRGAFFVEESIKLPAGAVGGPYALALSARSNVLQSFAGGPGQIALHGLWNVGGTLGTAVSHGCVRVDTNAISWLVTRIGPGTPVTVTR